MSPEKTAKRERHSGPKNKMEKAISGKTPKKDSTQKVQMETKEEGSPNSLKAKKKFQDQGHTRQRMSAEETKGN